ncbi:unnamed protein product [Dicrocoelium dendriticum]|nr:unnamed protein product [Dicrocoelium dendriticum]
MLHRGLVAALFFQFLLVPASSVLLPDFLQTQSSETCGRSAEFKPNTILVHHGALNVDGGFLKRLVVHSLNECYFACCSVAACTGAVFKAKNSKICLLFSCTHDNDCTYKSREFYDVILLSRATSNVHHVGIGQLCGPTKICQANHSVCSDGRCECQSGYLRENSACVQSVCQSPQLQFQCFDSSTCVAIYDKCNGIAECPDGSDEVGCSQLSDPTADRSSDHLHLPANTNETNGTREQLGSFHRFSAGREFTGTTRSPLRAHKQLSHFPDYPNVRNPTSWHRWETDEDWRDRDSVEAMRGGPLDLDPSSDNQRGLPFFQPKNPYATFKHHKAQSLASDFDGVAWERPALWSLRQRRFGHPHSTTSDDRPHRSKIPSFYSRNNYVLSHTSDETKPPRFHAPTVNPMDQYWDSYPGSDSILDLDDDTHPHQRHLLPSSSRTEELIDPSVFNHFRTQDREPSSAADVPHRHTVSSILNGARVRRTEPEYASSKDLDVAASGSLHPKSSPPGDTVLNVLGRSRNESHTSILILSFGLGLVCCFIGLLILEWRRRTRTSTWAMRRRPAKLPVLFNERGKPAAVQMRSNRRPKTTVRAMTNPTGSDDENEALCNGLVL